MYGDVSAHPAWPARLWQGSSAIKRAAGSGTALKVGNEPSTRYFNDKVVGYVEVDIDVGSNKMASGIFGAVEVRA